MHLLEFIYKQINTYLKIQIVLNCIEIQIFVGGISNIVYQ